MTFARPLRRLPLPTALALGVALGWGLGSAGPAQARVERVDRNPFAAVDASPNPCRRYAWWPAVVPPPGWHREDAASRAQGLNVLAPDGVKLASTPVVIYVRALYGACVPKVHSLSELIARDRAQFVGTAGAGVRLGGDAAVAAGTVASRQRPLMAADGRRFPVLEFVSPGPRGPWERVAYGTETAEFYLLFTLSADSYDAYVNAVPVLDGLIERYGRVALPAPSASASAPPVARPSAAPPATDPRS